MLNMGKFLIFFKFEVKRQDKIQLVDAEFYIMIRTNNFCNLLQKVVSKGPKFALKCQNLVEYIDTNILIPVANKCRVFTNNYLIIQTTCINTFYQLVNNFS